VVRLGWDGVVDEFGLIWSSSPSGHRAESANVDNDLDPITLELVQEGMIATVSEMRAYLWRTA